MKLNRFLLLTLGATIGLTSLTSKAEALIASVKTFGMAATGIAYPQDAFAAVFNPAGNAEVGDRADGDLVWSRDFGHTKISGNTLPQPILNIIGGPVNGTYPAYKTKDFYCSNFAINKTWGCNCEWSTGLVIYNRNFSKTTYKQPFYLLGTSNLGMEYLHETVSGVLAYKINECFNVGLTVNYMIQRLKVNGIEKADQGCPPNPFVGPVCSVNPGHVTNRGYDWSTGWGVTLGAQWHIFEGLTIGATYQPQTTMTKFKKYNGFLAQQGKFNIPQVFSAGIAWRFIECATIAFDVQYYDWKQIRALHNPLYSDGELQALGANNGPGFGWRSQVFYRLGVDYAFSDNLIVRAGFRTSNQVVRRSQTVVNQLALDVCQTFITAGATYIINCDYEASIFGAYGFKYTRKGKGSITPGLPAPFGPGGFGGGESDLTQEKMAIGLGFGWNY